MHFKVANDQRSTLRMTGKLFKQSGTQTSHPKIFFKLLDIIRYHSSSSKLLKRFFTVWKYRLQFFKAVEHTGLGYRDFRYFPSRDFKKVFPKEAKHLCSDPNNESDPSSEYSPLGLTHVMNQYLGQKFTTGVKINCLDTILKPRNGIPRPCTVHE